MRWEVTEGFCVGEGHKDTLESLVDLYKPRSDGGWDEDGRRSEDSKKSLVSGIFWKWMKKICW